LRLLLRRNLRIFCSVCLHRLYSFVTAFLIHYIDEKNEKRKGTIRAKAAEYLERAEQIKEIIDSGEDSKQERAGSGGAARSF
jgi:hypothetical protein